jgi:aspartate/methionine/tyrosine aminotransferase
MAARQTVDFRVNTDLAAEAGPLDGVLVASPANPTGTALTTESLRALITFTAQRNILLIVDEIYHGITYGAPAETVLKFSERAVAINSFSKFFSMTGWRLGWMVVPKELLRPVECLAQNLFISPPSLSQWAALAAFDAYDELDANVARYAKNRDILLHGLRAAGFGAVAPADGAFYLYADISRFAADSQDYCRRMLAETGVAATPGIDFDPREGRNFVRFSYAGPTKEMIEAARRLKDWRA